MTQILPLNSTLLIFFLNHTQNLNDYYFKMDEISHMPTRIKKRICYGSLQLFSTCIHINILPHQVTKRTIILHMYTIIFCTCI